MGRIANGATVEQEVPNSFSQGDTITFNLNRPDFTTARRLADVVNDLVGPNTAQAMDATSIKVFAPRIRPSGSPTSPPSRTWKWTRRAGPPRSS